LTSDQVIRALRKSEEGRMASLGKGPDSLASTQFS
jgi:hypothetical protein